jgi:sRNA-binding regulator protein Hfq
MWQEIMGRFENKKVKIYLWGCSKPLEGIIPKGGLNFDDFVLLEYSDGRMLIKKEIIDFINCGKHDGK